MDNSKEYDFKVRATIGSGALRTGGVASNKATVDVADQTPSLTGSIAGQAPTQGVSYTSATSFPAATGEDQPFTYSVASLPPEEASPARLLELWRVHMGLVELSIP